MKYHKLVRDRIPEHIQKRGATPVTHKAGENEYWRELRKKLQEEVNEYLEDEETEELADILEVIYAICKHKKTSFKELEAYRKKKAHQKGRFNQKIILEEVKEK